MNQMIVMVSLNGLNKIIKTKKEKANSGASSIAVLNYSLKPFQTGWRIPPLSVSCI